MPLQEMKYFFKKLVKYHFTFIEHCIIFCSVKGKSAFKSVIATVMARGLRYWKQKEAKSISLILKTVISAQHPPLPFLLVKRGFPNGYRRVLGCFQESGLITKQVILLSIKKIPCYFSGALKQGYIIYFFILWQNTHNVKFTIFSIFKCTVQWHSVHPHCFPVIIKDYFFSHRKISLMPIE